MRKVIKFVNKKKPVIITKNGVNYKRVDLGGHTMDIRIKSEKEFKNDVKSKSENKPSKQDISPQQLKNILEAMSKEEKKVQEKINKKKFKGNPKSNKKDW